MRCVVEPTAEAAGERAAAFVAERLRAAITARGQALLALSGGNSPAPLLRWLAAARLDWNAVQVYQVDERIAPDGDPARNVGAIAAALVAAGPLPAANLHAMPVTEPDIGEAAAAYGAELEARAGRPAVLDCVHLGLGPDGHTASLFPGDPVLEETARPVALAGRHAGFRRMTLTLPVLNGARGRLWFVTSAGKVAVLKALVAGQLAAPAGRVTRGGAIVYADAAAGAQISGEDVDG